MEAYRARRGSDGRKAFAIPMEFSSADLDLRALDRLSMTDWMRANGWASEPLTCTSITVAATITAPTLRISPAWAGIHYFAARDGRAADDDTPSILTWPRATVGSPPD